ncbi:MAG TPA: HAMP domain-containing histidine kinase [Planctomycetes bacterium]|nr:HAMP domain-containing histidine kinase [Planctomycetota bacterium]
MKCPIVVWLIFATCVMSITGVMAWLTVRAVTSVHEEQRREVAESSERLALWRIDSALMPLIIQESARQHMLYVGDQLPLDASNSNSYRADEQIRGQDQATNAPAGQANWSPVGVQPGGVQAGGVQANQPAYRQLTPLNPAPTAPSQQSENQGPQTHQQQARQQRQVYVPQGRPAQQELFQQFSQSGSQQIPAGPTNFVLPTVAPPARVTESATPFVQLYFSSSDAGMRLTSAPLAHTQPVGELWQRFSTNVTVGDFSRQLPSADEDTVEVVTVAQRRARKPTSRQGKGAQTKGALEQQQDLSQRLINVGNNVRQFVDYNVEDNRNMHLPANIRMGPLGSFWKGDMLVLARRMRVRGEDQVQGCLLDWKGLRPWLVDQVVDLLPNARLEPAVDVEAANSYRVLASLPVILVPGELDFVPQIGNRLLTTLAFAWTWLVLASVTVGVLLFAVMRISDRRAAFVSAVTHELRTPLTTFQLYTDLLVGDQGLDGDKRHRYVSTLKKEAHRLAHLVENVLAYSQLERGSLGLRIGEIDVVRVLEDVIPRLDQRCDRAEVKLETRFPSGDTSLFVKAEHAGLERVVANLIDNSCKYGMSKEQPAKIELSVQLAGKRVEVRVRDFGPGIDTQVRGRLFRPFSKSAHDAARSAPGVGLGLSLSRRIARAMQGDLELESTSSDGTTFLLWLPVTN